MRDSQPRCRSENGRDAVSVAEGAELQSLRNYLRALECAAVRAR